MFVPPLLLVFSADVPHIEKATYGQVATSAVKRRLTHKKKTVTHKKKNSHIDQLVRKPHSKWELVAAFSTGMSDRRLEA